MMRDDITSSRLVNVAKTILQYVLCAVLVLATLFLVFDLKNADMTIPISDEGDGLFVQMHFKSIHESGLKGAYVIESLSAPTAMDMRDYPNIDMGTWAWIRILSMFTQRYEITFNLFIFSTYFIVAFMALFIFQKMNIRYWIAMPLAILYAFIPYHIFRSGHTLFLMYAFAPLAILLSLRLIQNPDWFFYNKGKFQFNKHTLFCVVSCFLISMTGMIYYAFFAGFIFLITTIFACGIVPKEQVKQTLINGALIIATLVVALVINLSPYIFYWLQNGQSGAALARAQGDAEIYSLKIIQLILPQLNHRIPLLQAITQKYSAIYPLVNENSTSTLGLIGAASFLMLVLWLLIRNFYTKRMDKERYQIIDLLATLNLFLVLLTTIGGGGSFISMFLFSAIRGYNRVSIMISFVTFAAAGLALNWLTYKRKPLVSMAIGALLLVVGIFDQTNNLPMTTASLKAEHEFRARETSAVISNFNQGEMVLQLPYNQFPSGMYDDLIPYLNDHENKLRWSAGYIAGRQMDSTMQRMLALPDTDMITEAKQMGYSGILVQKQIFDCAAKYDGLRVILGEPVYESDYYVVYRIK